MAKTTIFNFFLNLLFIFILIINIFLVTSSSSVEPIKCLRCKYFFNKVERNLPDEMDKNNGFYYFNEVLKVFV